MLDFLKKKNNQEAKSGAGGKAVKKSKAEINRENKEHCIEFTMKKTGWDRKKAEQEIKLAKERTGIKYREYERFHFYKVPAEDQEKVYKEKKAEREFLKKRKQACIRAIAQATGWDEEYAKEQMETSMKEVGCRSYEYDYFGYFDMTLEEQKEAHARYLKSREGRAAKRAKDREKCIDTIMEAKGCDHETAAAEYDDAVARTGCRPDEYLEYEFYNLTPEKQDSILLLSHIKKIRKAINFDRFWYRVFKFKDKTNELLADYTKRKWCVSTEVSFEEFRDLFANSKKVFYKAYDSFGGKGAKAFELNDDNIKDVYDEIQSMGKGMVEEFVVQHHIMNEMSPTAVNTIRIVSMASDEPINEDGDHFKIAWATLKMGGATGCVDNLRGGGVGAAVDLDTGTLCTDAVSDAGKTIYQTHPVTGTKIKGFKIPFFKEAVDMVREIVETKHVGGYIGWDVAITEDGPMLIEGNAIPGPTLLVLPYWATEGRGMKDYMQDQVKYFCEL